MSMDHERDLSESPNTEGDGGLFAARPIWEQRGRKRLGGRKAAAAPAPTISPEPRTFAAERDYEEPMALDTPVDPVSGDYPRASYADMHQNAAPATVATGAPLAASEAAQSDSIVAAPIGRPSTRADRAPRSKGVGPAAIAAGVVALGAIGAAGWYASRDNDGIPELAPGQVSEAQVATAPLPPVDLPPTPPAAAADTAVNPPPAAAEPPRASVQPVAPRRMASSTRTRPAAAAPSAEDTAVNTSTTAIPAGPQPYSTLNPGAAPPPPVNPTPTQAAPPPSETPAAVPATPPTLPTEATPPTDPAPTTTEPPM
jgi:hypothetical protein